MPYYFLLPVVVRHWGVDKLEGPTPEAERARDALMTASSASARSAVARPPAATSSSPPSPRRAPEPARSCSQASTRGRVTAMALVEGR
jgi:hypothetical protein